MSYKQTFVTRKLYKNGSEKIIIKSGYSPNIEKMLRAKRRKKLLKQIEYESIESKGQLNFETMQEYEEKKNKLDKKYAPKLENAIRSMNRSKNNLMDILKSNDFNFFVTLTFDKNKIDRLDDKKTRKEFAKFVKDLRKDFNNMIYVAVPEYHKKGGLHFHLLLGKVTAEELGLVDSGKFIKNGRCKGQTIFNVTKWGSGFSTATKVLDTNAVKYYLSKYLTKGKVDPRFFGKKRFYVSQNIERPQVEKMTFPCNDTFDIFDSIDKTNYNIDYEDLSKEYCVLSRQF